MEITLHHLCPTAFFALCNLCVAIAAAIHYFHEGDEFAHKLREIRENDGIDAVIREVCKLDPNGELGLLIKEKIELIKEWGWLK